MAPQTGRHGLVEAAAPLQACSRPVLPDVRVRPVQREALCARLRAGKAGAGSAADASARLERAPQGVGGALDPESKRLLASDVSDRPRAMAQRGGPQVAQG